MSKKKKLPTTAFQPAPQKTPKAKPPTSFFDERPSWRVGLLEMAGPYGWEKLAPEKALEIRQKLSYFESMTWGEILDRSAKQNHRVRIGRLEKTAQDRLEEIHQGDVDELTSLRLSGRERIWGIQDYSVLKVLWWDPDHAVCPALLKHT